MLIRYPSDIRPSEIMPREAYLNRRDVILGGGAFGAATLAAASLASPSRAASLFSTDENETSLEDITSYNNYYEFGVGKDDPAANAHTLTTRPWSVVVDGLVAHPAEFQIEDFREPLEERIYRLRCVEGWSMVIPWLGFPLAAVLKRAEPLGSAKFVAFETLLRPEEMPGQRALFPVLGSFPPPGLFIWASLISSAPIR